MKRKINLLIIFVLIAALASSVFAASGSTAYSIGVKHDSSDNDAGDDFTGNVSYAATVYAMMPSITSSYKNYSPSITYMRENGPEGVRRIGSRVVFLNGHANNKNILFPSTDKGYGYYTGVYYGNDFNSSSTGFAYVGIADSKTDMSGVDLISIVGCSTAVSSQNLTKAAHDAGAATAVGFLASINSRNSYGPEWLEKYNDSLSNGNSVADAINYATTLYPSSNLGDYVILYGSGGNTVRTSALSLSASEFEKSSANIQLQNITNKDNCVDAPIKTNKAEIEELINEIKSLDDTFNSTEYKMTINMYHPEQGNGIIKLTHFIDEEIKTNKVYLAIVENNRIVKINQSLVDMNTEASKKVASSEDDITKKVKKYKEKNNKKTFNQKLDNKTIKSEFHYDYKKNELTYEVKTYEVKEELEGVIVPSVVTEVIE